MTGLETDRAIKLDTEKLVADVSRRWPVVHMKAVHADMQYGQYAEAVLNLFAIAHKRHLELELLDKQQIVDLIGRMAIEKDVEDMLWHPRDSHVERSADDEESVMAFLR